MLKEMILFLILTTEKNALSASGNPIRVKQATFRSQRVCPIHILAIISTTDIFPFLQISVFSLFFS